MFVYVAATFGVIHKGCPYRGGWEVSQNADKSSASGRLHNIYNTGRWTMYHPVRSANISDAPTVKSLCTGSRYNSVSNTRLFSSHTRLSQHLSRHTSMNYCCATRQCSHCGQMLCGCSFPGRAPRQLCEHSVLLLQMSGTRYRLTFSSLTVRPLFVTDLTTYLRQTFFAATYT